METTVIHHPRICAQRPARTKDAEFLLQLFAERNAARFAPLGWSDGQLMSMLQMQYRARLAGYAARFAGFEGFVVCRTDQQPVGELLLHREDREVRVVDISISRAQRGQGIGTQLLLDLQRDAAGRRETITLSVDHGNPARRLYERLGFQETGRDALQADMVWRFTEMNASETGGYRETGQL